MSISNLIIKQMSIELFWNLGSQPARAVKAILDIGKIKYTLISKDLLAGQTRSQEYLKLNPLGQIPFIRCGSFSLGESNAILTYLCQKYTSIPRSYYGADLQSRAFTHQYMSWYQNYFRPALFKLILMKVYHCYKLGIPFTQNEVTFAEKQMFIAIRTLNNLLSNKKYLTGGNCTVADLLVYFQMTNLVYYGHTFDKYQHVARWSKDVQNIPEVNAINHEWFPGAQEFKKLLSSIQPSPKPAL